MNVCVGTLNVLNTPQGYVQPARDCNNPYSPMELRNKLGLDELDERLFPDLITGTRWRSYLCLAVADYSVTKILKASKNIKKKLGSRLGPGQASTLRAYFSTSNNLRDRVNPSAAHLEFVKFLKKKATTLYNRGLNGKESFYCWNDQDEKKWTQLLVEANGKPGSAYLKVYKILRKQLKQDVEVNDVVTEILKHPHKHFNADLWQACFGYALLMCLFGLGLNKQEIQSSRYALVWKPLLLKYVNSASKPIPGAQYRSHFKKWLMQVQEGQEPPLGKSAKQYWAKEKPVHDTHKLFLFHNLLAHQIPRQLRANKGSL